MESLSQSLRLVDADGFDVPVTEKGAPPVDPEDPADWPAWTDNFYYGTPEDLTPEDPGPADDRLDRRLGELARGDFDAPSPASGGARGPRP